MIIYESDELKITRQGNMLNVLDKLSGQWRRLDFSYSWFLAEYANIKQWNFCKQYPTVIPILIDLGIFEKWENGFRIKIEGGTYYFDMQMVYQILKYSNGNIDYRKYGERHRIDGPAVIDSDGGKEWWINGKLHRTDGPAVEYANGAKYWYINDNEITDDVKQWMDENNYNHPFDKQTQAEFILTFAG